MSTEPGRAASRPGSDTVLILGAFCLLTCSDFVDLVIIALIFYASVMVRRLHSLMVLFSSVCFDVIH